MGLQFLLDPIIRDSLFASILMCFSASLLGCFCVLRKKSLVGEVMSHAAFPGVALAYVFLGNFLYQKDLVFSLVILFLAFICSLVCNRLIRLLTDKNISEDAALCFFLSSGLGLGILIQSFLQKTHPLWFKKVELFFYGQAATLLFSHVVIYALFSILIVAFVSFNFQKIKLVLFDPTFAKVHGIKTKMLEQMMTGSIALSVVLGMRSVGIILVSGMLIIPVIAASQLTHRLKFLMVISALMGGGSALLGNIVCLKLPILWQEHYGYYLTVPLGPVILIIAFLICLILMLVAPKKGLIYRFIKLIVNRGKIREENALKIFWRHRDQNYYSFGQMKKKASLNSIEAVYFVLRCLIKGFIRIKSDHFEVTKKGITAAAHIVRLHRLFELYLSQELKIDSKDVHAIAEELEHVISPQMERQLTEILNNPHHDPHQQPIPKVKADFL
jgi:manganese/zinc/iron transport system permease protein